MKFLVISLMLAGSFIPSAMAQNASSPITEEAARAIGVDAYLYFLSAVISATSRGSSPRTSSQGKSSEKVR